jgi:hypothetical protein
MGIWAYPNGIIIDFTVVIESLLVFTLIYYLLVLTWSETSFLLFFRKEINMNSNHLLTEGQQKPQVVDFD